MHHTHSLSPLLFSPFRLTIFLKTQAPHLPSGVYLETPFHLFELALPRFLGRDDVAQVLFYDPRPVQFVLLTLRTVLYFPLIDVANPQYPGVRHTASLCVTVPLFPLPGMMLESPQPAPLLQTSFFP